MSEHFDRPPLHRAVLLLGGGTSVYVSEDADEVGGLLRAGAEWVELTDGVGRNVTIRAAAVQAFHPDKLLPRSVLQ